MKLFVHMAVMVMPLFLLIGCDSKPKPTDLPKNQIEVPKTRPTPAGGSNKPPQTGQNHYRTPHIEWSLA
jgi:hypothetical protein